MNNFETESKDFAREVRNRAAILVRDGYAAPYEAIDIARRQIMRERQAKARVRDREKVQNLFGDASTVN